MVTSEIVLDPHPNTGNTKSTNAYGMANTSKINNIIFARMTSDLFDRRGLFMGYIILEPSIRLYLLCEINTTYQSYAFFMDWYCQCVILAANNKESSHLYNIKFPVYTDGCIQFYGADTYRAGSVHCMSH